MRSRSLTSTRLAGHAGHLAHQTRRRRLREVVQREGAQGHVEGAVREGKAQGVAAYHARDPRRAMRALGGAPLHPHALPPLPRGSCPRARARATCRRCPVPTSSTRIDCPDATEGDEVAAERPGAPQPAVHLGHLAQRAGQLVGVVEGAVQDLRPVHALPHALGSTWTGASLERRRAHPALGVYRARTAGEGVRRHHRRPGEEVGADRQPAAPLELRVGEAGAEAEQLEERHPEDGPPRRLHPSGKARSSRARPREPGREAQAEPAARPCLSTRSRRPRGRRRPRRAPRPRRG